MRKGLFVLAVGSALAVGCVSAEAMPAPPADSVATTPGVILVAGGCGIGFHRGPYGGCLRNGFRPGFYGHPYYRRYWGWHRGWRRW